MAEIRRSTLSSTELSAPLMLNWRCGLAVLAFLMLLALSARGAMAQTGGLINLEAPDQHECIVDRADMISDADEAKIRAMAEQLLKDKAVPIIVVTINSKAEHDGGKLTIEVFARLLFDQWGIGYEKIDGVPWNYGILLLVSKNDRKARIELGADWRHDKDDQAQQIMDELIIPNFKAGDFSAGILAGVEGLDKLGRGLELPTRPRPWWHYALIAAVVGLAIFTAVSLFRRGAGGWAWLFWGGVFAVIGAILYHMASSSNSSGGGFSGGSFGGGFSGGGGATGSW